MIYHLLALVFKIYLNIVTDGNRWADGLKHIF